MGTLRLLLAIAVVMGHAGRTSMLSPYYCVQAFFVISGFYMALIWETRFTGHPFVFYVSRYSRLLVSYWLVAAVTLVAALTLGTNYIRISEVLHDDFPAPMTFTNLFIFGQDAVEFFTIDGRTASGWLLVPQGWSLGTELLFYLLVPFLVPLKTRTLLLLIATSLAVRLVIIGMDLPFFPWQQRFFPAEVMFFLLGILAYRVGPLTRSIWPVVACWLLITFIGRVTNEVNLLGSLAVGLVCFLCVPVAFSATNTDRSVAGRKMERLAKADRLIGELSYPIYLWHVFVLAFVGHGVLLWTLVLSILTVAFVELPMERIRRKYLVPRAARHPVPAASAQPQ